MSKQRKKKIRIEINLDDVKIRIPVGRPTQVHVVKKKKYNRKRDREKLKSIIKETG